MRKWRRFEIEGDVYQQNAPLLLIVEVAKLEMIEEYAAGGTIDDVCGQIEPFKNKVLKFGFIAKVFGLQDCLIDQPA